jgi:hypothetical protein
MARYAVLRIATVKTMGRVAGLGLHVERERETCNAGDGTGWGQRPTLVLAESAACVTETTRATAAVVQHEIIALVREVQMVCLDAV